MIYSLSVCFPLFPVQLMLLCNYFQTTMLIFEPRFQHFSQHYISSHFGRDTFICSNNYVLLYIFKLAVLWEILLYTCFRLWYYSPFYPKEKFQKQLEMPASLAVVIFPYGIIICTLIMILVLMATIFAIYYFSFLLLL